MAFIRDFPRITALLASMTAAYLLYMTGGLSWLHDVPAGSELVAVVVGGILFSTGFTAPFGIAVFVELADTFHPFLGALLGGLGSLLADLFIFQIVRFESMRHEFEKLNRTWILLRIKYLFHHPLMPEIVRIYALWSFAGIIIASPLPDELGIMMIGGLGSIHPTRFAVICYIANTVGILLIMLGARAVS